MGKYTTGDIVEPKSHPDLKVLIKQTHANQPHPVYSICRSNQIALPFCPNELIRCETGVPALMSILCNMPLFLALQEPATPRAVPSGINVSFAIRYIVLPKQKSSLVRSTFRTKLLFCYVQDQVRSL